MHLRFSRFLDEYFIHLVPWSLVPMKIIIKSCCFGCSCLSSAIISFHCRELGRWKCRFTLKFNRARRIFYVLSVLLLDFDILELYGCSSNDIFIIVTIVLFTSNNPLVRITHLWASGALYAVPANLLKCYFELNWPDNKPTYRTE